LQNPSQADIHGFWAQDGKLTICFGPMSGASSENTVQVQLKTLGDHNAKNALAAAAVAYAAGIELSAIQEGLEGFKPVSGRMCEHHLPSIYGQGRMIDDTYNANPDSVLAAIEVLRTMPGQRWLVLGDMGEVGNQGVQFHQEIGSYAQRQGIDRVYVTGDLCKHVVEGFQTSLGRTREVASQQAIYSNNMPDLLKRLQDDLQSSKEMDSISVLVKGSRFTKMERVVQALLAGESSCC
jgi:UDP-N-acetylmuramoyl-tripeptide--D-alanyl-D-alanine ligase